MTFIIMMFLIVTGIWTLISVAIIWSRDYDERAVEAKVSLVGYAVIFYVTLLGLMGQVGAVIFGISVVAALFIFIRKLVKIARGTNV